MKAASVRNLLRASGSVERPILAGLLATRSVWSIETFEANLRRALASIGNPLDLGCCLERGSFEYCSKSLRVSHPNESLIFFVLRLLERLRSLGPAPAADLMLYGRGLESFRRP